MYTASQFVFAVREIIHFEQLRGQSEWKTQAIGMVAGAIWQFNPDGIFFYAPANSREDIFPLKGKYVTQGNKVFFEAMTS